MIRIPNPQPRPPERFYHLADFTGQQTCPRANPNQPEPNVPDNFFEHFYVISLDGVANDYIQELGGAVCLAGSLTSSGVTPDDNPCNEGFQLRNWSKGSRTLEFVIYSHAIERYVNNSANVTGLARVTLAYKPDKRPVSI